MAQQPTTEQPASDDQKQDSGDKGLISILKNKVQQAKEFSQDAKAKIMQSIEDGKQYFKDTEDISKLMEMALTALESYKKTSDFIDEQGKGKVNILNQFASAKGVIYMTSWNAGFGFIGAGYSRGILIKKIEYGGWSLPIAIQAPELAVGPQARIGQIDQIQLLQDSKDVDTFINSKDNNKNLQLKSDAFIVIGNYGKGVNASVASNDKSIKKGDVATNIGTNDQKGIGIGATIGITTFTNFKTANKLFYGENYSINDILNTEANSDSDVNNQNIDSIIKFIDELTKFIGDDQNKKSQNVPSKQSDKDDQKDQGTYIGPHDE